jgi:hypothetical protein
MVFGKAFTQNVMGVPPGAVVDRTERDCLFVAAPLAGTT